jgi:hypothetical protein
MDRRNMWLKNIRNARMKFAFTAEFEKSQRPKTASGQKDEESKQRLLQTLNLVTFPVLIT